MPQSQSNSQFHRVARAVVLTGDLVSSSKLRPEEIAEAMRALEGGATDLGAELGFGSPVFTRYRGDGWQCLGPEPRFGLRAALILRARLSSLGRPFDTRISVGIGAAVFDRATNNLDGAGGPAFELAGRALDRMPHAQRFAISWEDPPEDAGLLRAIFALADEISRNWTPAQARVFAAALGPGPRPSQEALARAQSITQQMIAKHLSGGGDWALRQALEAVEGKR